METRGQVLSLCLLALLLAIARSSPSCHISSRNTSASVTCSSFTSPSDFEHFIQRPLSHPTLTFLLKDSRLEQLPSGAFTDVSATSLEFNNVTVESFDFEESNPFAGLQTSLEKITFSGGSSIPSSWVLFKELQSLKTLVLSGLTQVNLTRDFNNLTSSIRNVVVESSPIGHVDDDCLASLVDLELLSVQNSNLTLFLRSMLPKPAPMLKTLELPGNHLALLPKDFGAEFPVLRELDLSNNQIVSFDEEALQPLQGTVTRVNLDGNPLHCDCRIKFLLSFPDIWRQATCTSPENLGTRNATLKDVTEADLECAESSS